MSSSVTSSVIPRRARFSRTQSPELHPGPAATSSSEKRFDSGYPRHAFHHFLRGGDPAEPSIDAADNLQRGLRIARRAGVRIENLRCVDSLHGMSVDSAGLRRSSRLDFGQFLFQQLLVIQVAVVAVQGEQFVVCAQFHDAGRRAARRCGRHCGRWKRGGR